jgi:nucleoside-diphosphate-sugar epimerase
MLDRSDGGAVRAVVENQRIDLLVDVVAYTLEQTQQLLASIGGRVSRYVMISSSDVYRNYALLQRREVGAADEGILREDAPLRTSRFPYRGEIMRGPDDPQRWMDFYDKIPIEEAVRSVRCAWTILRLPMVFGAGAPQARFAWMIVPMLRDKDIEAPSGWLDWITTYDYVDNVGSAAAVAALRSEAQNRVFNIACFEPVSHSTWIERFRSATGWTGAVRSTSDSSNPVARATSAIDLRIPLQVSGETFTRQFGFTPLVSVEQAVDQTVHAAKAS